MSDLIVIEKTNALQVFTEPEAIKSILKQIETEALALAPDISTAKGRKDIASVAYKVARAKTYIDGVGKDLVTEMKEVPKKIDATRKHARDFLDDLKDRVRKPLDDWEAEQERIEAEKKAAEDAAALAKQIEFDHEIALLLNAEYDRKKEAERAAAEQARIEREQQIAREAEERARREAEAKAQAEREASIRAIAEAQAKAVAAERAKLEAEEREKTNARLAAERAEREKKQAIEDERRRVEAKAEAERRAAEARMADTENRRQVNLKALSDLSQFASLTEEQAKRVVSAIAKGQIRGIQINY